MVNKHMQINTLKAKVPTKTTKDPKQFDDNWDRIFGKKKNVKDKPNPVEDYLPLWKGELVFPIKGEEISSQTEWQEIAHKKFMLFEATGEFEENVFNLLDYFNSEQIIYDLLATQWLMQ